MTEPREHEIIDLKWSATKADGAQLLTKQGKPMWRVDLQIAERPGVWINGLAFADPSAWKGSKKKLALYTEDYNGQPHPKFKLVSDRPRQVGSFTPEQAAQLIEHFASIARSLEYVVIHLKGGTL